VIRTMNILALMIRVTVMQGSCRRICEQQWSVLTGVVLKRAMILHFLKIIYIYLRYILMYMYSDKQSLLVARYSRNRG
jgi:hypothetical protein